MARHARGFTLIELMIVLTVAAVILVIAIPAYNAQMRKSRRSEAQAALGSLVLKQEQYRANNPSYATTAQLVIPPIDHYDLAVTAQSATGFTMTATAKSGDDQNNDRGSGTGCATLTVQSAGGAQSRTPTGCWQ